LALDGEITDSGFGFTIPSAKLYTSVSSVKVDFDEENIKINPFDVKYNAASKINVKGDIKNYVKKPDIDIFLSGCLATSDIRQTLGNEASFYIP